MKQRAHPFSSFCLIVTAENMESSPRNGKYIFPWNVSMLTAGTLPTANANFQKLFLVVIQIDQSLIWVVHRLTSQLPSEMSFCGKHNTWLIVSTGSAAASWQMHSMIAVAHFSATRIMRLDFKFLWLYLEYLFDHVFSPSELVPYDCQNIPLGKECLMC